MTYREGRDAWLFLTPEVEREVATLVGRLGGPSGRARRRITELVEDGDAERWFAYLRDCRAFLDRAVRDGRDGEACTRLALVLREQYLLAPGVPGLPPRDDRELRRLDDVLRTREHAWTSP